MGKDSILYPILSMIPNFYKGGPHRIMSLFVFSMAGLTALGGDAITYDLVDSMRKKIVTYGSIVILGMIGLSIYSIYAVVNSSRFQKFVSERIHDLMNWNMITYQISNILMFLIMASISIGLIYLLMKKKIGKSTFILLAILIVSSDLIIIGIDYNTTVEQSTVYPLTDSVDFLKKNAGISRIMTPGGISLLTPNSAVVYGLYDVRGYSTMVSSRYRDYVGLFNGSRMTVNGLLKFTGYEESKLWDLLNVKYVVTSPRFRFESPVNLTLVYSGEVKIYENLNCLPRAFVVHRAKIVDNPSAILKEIGSVEFDPTSYVILEHEVENDILNYESEGKSQSLAEIIEYSPNRVVIRANMSENGYLLLADAYDSNWEVYVDGKKEKILVADYIFRAVYLNEGIHVVEFNYNPIFFQILVYISISVISIVIIIVTILTWKSYLNRLIKKVEVVLEN